MLVELGVESPDESPLGRLQARFRAERGNLANVEPLVVRRFQERRPGGRQISPDNFGLRYTASAGGLRDRSEESVAPSEFGWNRSKSAAVRLCLLGGRTQ